MVLVRLLAAALTSLAANLLWVNAVVGGSGAVYFDPGELRLGAVPLFVETQFAVPVVNGLREAIKFEVIMSSCGCASVSFDKMTLDPGERTVARGSVRPSVAGPIRVALAARYHGAVSMQRGPAIGAIVTANAVQAGKNGLGLPEATGHDRY